MVTRLNSMKRLILTRIQYEETQTRGILLVLNDNEIVFDCKTLELPYRDNQRGISCVPAGVYNIQKEYSPKFERDLYELKDVPSRSEIKIHQGNFSSALEGCILVGQRFTDIDHNGIADVTRSVHTLVRLHNILSDTDDTTITIYGQS